MNDLKEDGFLLTEEEIKEIEKLFIEGHEVSGEKKIKLCDCKGGKILTKAQNRGPGYCEADIEIMCLDCGRSFEGYSKTQEGYMFALKLSHKKAEIMKSWKK